MMPTMQTFLALSLALHALAAPIQVRQVFGPGGHPNDPALSGSGPDFEDQRGAYSPGDRRWNVLYPRPRQPLNEQSPPEASGTPVPVLTTSSLVVSVPTFIPVPTDPTPSAVSSLPLGSIQPSNSSSSASSSLPTTNPISQTTQLVTITSPIFNTSTSFSFPTGSGPATSVQSPSSIFSPSISSGAAPPTATPPSGNNPLRLSLVNNLGITNGNAYISALDASGRVVMVTSSGSFYYLPDTGSTSPQALPAADITIPLPAPGQALEVTIPGFVAGARVWFAAGTLDFAVVGSVNGPALVEPTAANREDASASTNWGFVELAWVEGYGLFANVSFVDFLGLPLALELTTSSAATQSVPSVPRDAVQQVCDRLRAQGGRSARRWAELCVTDGNGVPLRVISPAVLISQQPDAFSAFFSRYVDRVWERFATEPLTVDTQTSAGLVSCRTVGQELQCDGDNRSYAQPNAGDIFGCNTGPFGILETDGQVHRAIVPRLCAAFHRGTLLLDGGNVQPALPPSSYYTSWPYNLYSALLHEVELDGRGYAFPYDDVAPSVDQGVAGIVAAPDPVILSVFVGGR